MPEQMPTIPVDSLTKVDQELDKIVVSMMTLGDYIDKAIAENPGSKESLLKIKDLFETGVAPYMVDIVEISDALDKGD